MKWTKKIIAQVLLVDGLLFWFFHRVYNNFTQRNSNLSEESEHLKMTAVIGSFQGSHKAHDRYELESLKQQFDLEIYSICTTNS